jgi:hypothetical protein
MIVRISFHFQPGGSLNFESWVINRLACASSARLLGARGRAVVLAAAVLLLQLLLLRLPIRRPATFRPRRLRSEWLMPRFSAAAGATERTTVGASSHILPVDSLKRESCDTFRPAGAASVRRPDAICRLATAMVAEAVVVGAQQQLPVVVLHLDGAAAEAAEVAEALMLVLAPMLELLLVRVMRDAVAPCRALAAMPVVEGVGEEDMAFEEKACSIRLGTLSFVNCFPIGVR